MKQKAPIKLTRHPISTMLQKAAAITVAGDWPLWERNTGVYKAPSSRLSAFSVPALWWGAFERELFGAARFPVFPLRPNSSKTYPATLSMAAWCGWFYQIKTQATAMKKLPTVTFNDTELKLIDSDGQQWLTAADISRALGYSRSDAAGKIYDRNKAEFDDSMSQTVNLGVRGIPVKTRVFNKRGSHLIAMFAKTQKSADFRTWVLDVLENKDTTGTGGNGLQTPTPRIGDYSTTYLLVKMCGAEPIETTPLTFERLQRFVNDEHPGQLLINRATVAKQIDTSMTLMHKAIANAASGILPLQLLLENNDVKVATQARLNRAMVGLGGVA